MLGKNLQPKTVAELVRSLTQARVDSFKVYEGNDLNNLPSKQDLSRTGSSVVVIRFR